MLHLLFLMSTSLMASECPTALSASDARNIVANSEKGLTFSVNNQRYATEHKKGDVKQPTLGSSTFTQKNQWKLLKEEKAETKFNYHTICRYERESTTKKEKYYFTIFAMSPGCSVPGIALDPYGTFN